MNTSILVLVFMIVTEWLFDCQRTLSTMSWHIISSTMSWHLALSHCAWKSLKAFLQIIVPEQEETPGAVTAIQTLGDFLNFNPP